MQIGKAMLLKPNDMSRDPLEHLKLFARFVSATF